MRVWILLVLPLFVGLGLEAAVVRSLAGQQWTIDDLRLSDGRVVVSDGTLAMDDIDWIQMDATPPLLEPNQGLVVLLRDGSQLPVATLGRAARDDTVRVVSSVGTFDLALGDELIGWGPADWLAGLVAVGDVDDEVDRLLLGETTWPGAINGIASGEVLFEAQATEQEIAHALDKVHGLRLAVPIEAPTGFCFQSRLAADLPASWFRLGSDGWRLAIGKYPLTSPPRQPLVAQGGRRVWLGELATVPGETVQQGAFGVVWPYSVDVNIDGSPLVLGGRRYDRGLVAHSQARLVWDLQGAFERFSCRLGIADTVGREGDCLVRILGDERELLANTRLRGGEEPREINLDLSGVDRLVIDIQFGERYDIGDHVAFAGAWLLRKE